MKQDAPSHKDIIGDAHYTIRHHDADAVRMGRAAAHSIESLRRNGQTRASILAAIERAGRLGVMLSGIASDTGLPTTSITPVVHELARRGIINKEGEKGRFIYSMPKPKK